MRLTVTKLLNKRIGAPSVNAQKGAPLEKGDEIDVVEQVKGDSYDGNNLWYKDAGNNFYWSGGVSAGNLSIVSEEPGDFWFKELNISFIWTQYKEQGSACKILILDTGINDYIESIKNNIVSPIENFAVNSSTTNSIDSNCHGTHCAGLIAAKDNIGSAPEAKLYVAKISENGQLDNSETIKKALREFLKKDYEFDIISISQTLTAGDDELYNLIQNHVDKNRIIFAAIGNDSTMRNSNYKRYPAFYDNCISVGACENNRKLSGYTYSPDKVDIFSYGSNIKSIKNSVITEPLTGTSQATAIVAGISSLVVSYLKKNGFKYDQNSIKNFLKKYSHQLNDSSKYHLISPVDLFAKLNSFKRYENKNLQNCINSDININV